MKEEKSSVLEINNLSVSFSMYDKGFKKRNLEVVHELNINAYEGEIIAVVGSSGSGKSILAHAVMGILPSNAKVKGDIKFCGKTLDDKYIKEIRGKEIGFIPQSIDFLDPLMKIGKQVMGVNGIEEKMKEVFKRYSLDEKVAELYKELLKSDVTLLSKSLTESNIEAIDPANKKLWMIIKPSATL